MGIEDLIKCYQKKIGTYDKQQWEKNVEQRIVYGINHIQFKRATPKTDLIDLDLVRGSSFTKAKPKHGIITVARLSTLRILFLPLYSKWWVQQTSGKIFAILLVLYLLQLFNIAIYSYNTSTVPDDFLQNVPSSELIVPILMMWVLSFIHSQIVATNPGPDNLKLQPKYSNSYRRPHRTRKVRHAMFCETAECYDGDAPGAASMGRRKKWKDKEVLNRTSSKTENVSFDLVVSRLKSNKRCKGNSDRSKPSVDNRNHNVRRLNNGHPLEDDGFESLNGNGSSPSDNGDEGRVARKSKSEHNVPSKTHVDAKNKQSTSGIRCDQWVKDVQGSRKKFHLSRRQSAPDLRFSSGELDTDSDTSIDIIDRLHVPLNDRRASQIPVLIKSQVDSICDTDEEGECETLSSPETVGSGQIKATSSGIEWTGITTNSEDCSYSSDFSEIDVQSENYDNDAPPTSILSPYCGPSDRVSCTIWEKREIKKADLSVFDISSVIIAKVEAMPESMDYFYIGMFTTTIISMLPVTCRFCYSAIDSSNLDELQVSLIEISHLVLSKFSNSLCDVLDSMLGTSTWQRTVFLTATFQRLVLGFLLFFLLAVAERTFKQRFLYAKLFSHLTSSRRAKKSELPHFRLNKVRNIKTWLSIRSYLRKRGPQRSVDVIVSAAFIVTLLLLSFLCMELLKEPFVLNSQYNLEIMIWSIGLGIMVLRFMTLGVKINKKYRNLSVLITEQINLYLQIEQKPNKKEELMVANSVLKLAADLLKELESQFKILGLSANPFLYNITKVVILSALSGVLSEILGFKLKLHKIKIK